MSGKTPQKNPSNPGGGIFGYLTHQGKLIVRLILDSRVNPLLKILPIGSFLYMIIPDLVIGPLDDAFILWLGTTLFVELCPRPVVQEHRDDLTSVVEGEWREVVDDDESDPPQSYLPRS